MNRPLFYSIIDFSSTTRARSPKAKEKYEMTLMKKARFRIYVLSVLAIGILGLAQTVHAECKIDRVVQGGAITARNKVTSLVLAVRDCPDVFSMGAEEDDGITFEIQEMMPTRITATVTATNVASAGEKRIVLAGPDFARTVSPEGVTLWVYSREAVLLSRQITSATSAVTKNLEAFKAEVRNANMVFEKKLAEIPATTMAGPTEAQIAAIVDAKVNERMVAMYALVSSQAKDIRALEAKTDAETKDRLEGQVILANRQVSRGGLAGLLGKKEFIDLSLSRKSKETLEARAQETKDQKRLAEDMSHEGSKN